MATNSTATDRAAITEKVEAATEKKINVGRKAWRGVMLGAVGSLAIFLTTLGNLGKTYQTHGNPLTHLERHDVILFSLPVLVMGYFLLETTRNGSTEESE